MTHDVCVFVALLSLAARPAGEIVHRARARKMYAERRVVDGVAVVVVVLIALPLPFQWVNNSLWF